MPERPLSALGLLERARALGVGVVQYCDNLPLLELDAAELEELIARAGEYGVEIELGARGLSGDNVLGHLALARRLKAKFVRFVVDKDGDEPSPEEALARIQQFLPEFIEAGVLFAIENHDRFPASVLQWMIEALGDRHSGICLDTVNSMGALETPRDVVPSLAPYTVNLHVKDFRIGRIPGMMGFEVTGCAAGQGMLDIPWVLDHLRGAGRDVNAILELWTPAAGSLEATIAQEHRWAESSVAYMRTLIPD